MRERERSSYDQSGYDLSVYQSGPGGMTLTRRVSGVHNYVKSYEYISDVGHGRGGFNPVSHVKYTGEPRNRSGIYYGYSYPFPNDVYQFVISQVMGITSLSELLAAMPTVPSDELESLHYRSFMAAVTQIPEDVSVPNFLIELREVKDLIPKIQGFLKTISGGFLNIEFGWKPMISDIRKMLKSAETVRKRIAYLKKIYNKPTTIHFGVSNFWVPEIQLPDVLDSRTAGSGTLSTVMGANRLPYDVRLTTYQCQYHSSITVLSTVTGLDAADAFLKGMLANLGFLNGAKVTWNALPWSWLIEWFVNLDRFLDSYANAPFKGTISVLNSGYSLKESALLEVGWYYVTDNSVFADSSSVTEWTPSCTYHLERYTRYNGLPVSTSLFRDGSLTAKQWAILLALIHQRS